jgi:circadian clock protein KaiB
MKKSTSTPITATDKFEAIDIRPDSRVYVLRLYVYGMSQKSSDAIAAIEKICNRHLHGRFTLEVIDITMHPTIAMDDDIVAIPMLEKILPLPKRRMVGDLSDEEKVLSLLELKKALPLSPEAKS